MTDIIYDHDIELLCSGGGGGDNSKMQEMICEWVHGKLVARYEQTRLPIVWLWRSEPDYSSITREVIQQTP